MSPARLAAVVAALVLFIVLATANAGGYRYGVSDQAFYVPAISLRADPALFPRDREVFEPQMAWWLGDEILGRWVQMTNMPLPTLFGAIYLITMIVLAAGVVRLARTLGCGWPSVALALIVMTLRHRIAKTGANSIEGYMHPRMLAFAIGLFILAALVRRRWIAAAMLTALAAVVHTSTAMWFGGVGLVVAIWDQPARRVMLAVAAAVALLGPALVTGVTPGLFARMDAEWLTVLADRDYLFSLAWPAYAWLLNLGYVILIGAISWYRHLRHLAVPGEAGLLTGLAALVVVFLGTLPATEAGAAFFVTLQANRVFWILDAVLAVLGAWWLMEVLPRLAHPRLAEAVPAALLALSIGRGAYVLGAETNRALVEPALPETGWTEVMQWLETRPSSWHVLADPAHAWRHGSSVRVAARRDTLLELGKDPAMAMYDEALARRVADRTRALLDFDTLTLADVRRLDATYDLDVFVDVTSRRFDLPELFRNRDFVAYDLR